MESGAVPPPGTKPFRNARPSLVPALALAVALSAGAGCRSVSAKGIVRTLDGRPVPAASIVLLSTAGPMPLPRTSEPSGCFTAFGPARTGGEFLLRVEAAGYEPVEVRLAPARENLLSVVLAPPPGPSSARLLAPGEAGPLYTFPCERDVRGNAISLR